MSKILVIVESPAKCKTIEKYLGASYRCMASCGHIRELDTEKGLECIDIAHGFTPTFRISPKKHEVIKNLRDAMKTSSHIILATDDDREGEAIAWHLAQVLHLPIASTERIVFHEITKPALERAIASPRRIDMNRVLSQQARQVLDLLVGYSISPVLWKYIARKDTPLSAGRCQSPALRLVYEKEEEIREHPSIGVYSMNGIFSLGSDFNTPCPYILSSKLPSSEDVENFLEESVNHSHIFTRTAPSIKECAPPEPLITTTLQRRAHSSLRLSSKQTMDAAQILYENGYITYMRTDSKALSTDFLKTAKDWITDKLGEDFIGDRIKKGLSSETTDIHEDEHDTGATATSGAGSTPTIKKLIRKKGKAATKEDNKNPKGAQEAHEAIRPTHIECEDIPCPESESLRKKITNREIQLYRLIWTITVQSCCSPAKYQSLQSRITAPNELHYSREDRSPVFLGWMAISNRGSEVEDGEAVDSISTKRGGGGRAKKQKLLKAVNNSSAETEELDTSNPDIAVSATAISTPLFETILKTPNSVEVSYLRISSQYGLANQTHRLCESTLINQLEKMGIGRPSTYSSIVDTLFKREYVKRGNVEGNAIEVIEHLLVDDTITEQVVKKKTGAESGRMLMEPTGVLVIQLLIKYFNPLFSYEYTSHLETQLDKVAKGDRLWNSVCDEAYREIQRLIEGLKGLGAVKEHKQEIKMDELHTYQIGKFGAVIKKIDPSAPKGTKPEFLRVREGIDPRDIESGKLTVEDIVDLSRPPTTENLRTDGKLLGEIDGHPVLLKDGKFGHYINWKGNNLSLKKLMQTKKLTADSIALKDIEPYLTTSKDTTPETSSGSKMSSTASSTVPSLNPNVVRILTPTLSIRTGKYGHYIFFKKPSDEKPTFFPLKGFKGDYLTCPDIELLKWIMDTYSPEL